MRGGAAPLRGVGRVVEWNARVYSRVWQGSVITGFVTPLLFLLAIGVTLGGRIDDGGGLELPYAEFVAPGLLASTAMQVGIFESSFPVVAGLHWRRTFHAVLATPIALPALVIGRLLWVAVRITLACAAFLLIALAFGLLSSPLALLAVPAGVLAGTAFSAPMEAFAATQSDDAAFAMVFRLGVLPMTLFSGAFFPVDRLPDAVEWLVWISPLFHGTELCRALTTGETGWLDLVHLGVLVGLTVLGAALARITYRRRMTV